MVYAFVAKWAEMMYNCEERLNDMCGYICFCRQRKNKQEKESLGVVAVPAGAIGFGFWGGSFNGAVHNEYSYI